MIVIGDYIFGDDIIEQKFVCDLSRCKGACCVEGEGGAPLEDDELALIDKHFPKFKKYLSPQGLASIEKLGLYVEEADDEYTKFATPLIEGTGACVFVNFDKNGTTYCGIEKAFLDGKIDWKKPISCHLYPIRVKPYEGFTAVNYDEWDICSPACKLGEKLKVPVYQFLKEPIIRRFGIEIFEALEATAKRNA